MSDKKKIEWIIMPPEPRGANPEIDAALDWLDAWGCITDGAGKHSGHCNVCAPDRESPKVSREGMR